MKFVLLFFVLFISFFSFSQECFLPKPAGNYHVGCKVMYFTDFSRKEKLTLKANDYRTLKVKIWYPSDETGDSVLTYLKEYPSDLLLKRFSAFSEDICFFERVKTCPTNTYANVKLSDKVSSFPVIFFSQGYYFGLDDLCFSYMENLASQGYIVVSITHPYDQVITNTENNGYIEINSFRGVRAFYQWKKTEFFHDKDPDPQNKNKINRIMRAYFRGMRIFDKSLDLWVADTQFVLDTLTEISNSSEGHLFFGKLNLNEIGAMGQSFGGAVAGQLCYIDQRFKAAVNLDCFQFGDIYQNSLNKPILLIESENYPLWSLGNDEVYQYTNPYFKITLKDTRHYIFSDCPLLPFITNEKRKELTGTENAAQHIKAVNNYITDFFNHFLKGEPVNTAELKIP